MKTNQVMTRKMGQFEVMQRTSDGMFNATTLLKQWNGTMGMKKEMGDYFENHSTKEFICTIIERENHHRGNSPYDGKSTKSVVYKSRANRGANAGTWMHPLLFIDFAMWINSSFKYDVLKFVYDELVKYRNEAGDAYREVSAAVQKIVGKSEMTAKIQQVAKALNHIVFGSHESEIRNKMAEEVSMRELFELERKVASLINEGFIKDFDGLLSYLRRLWNNKYRPAALWSA